MGCRSHARFRNSSFSLFQTCWDTLYIWKNFWLKRHPDEFCTKIFRCVYLQKNGCWERESSRRRRRRPLIQERPREAERLVRNLTARLCSLSLSRGGRTTTKAEAEGHYCKFHLYHAKRAGKEATMQQQRQQPLRPLPSSAKHQRLASFFHAWPWTRFLHVHVQFQLQYPRLQCSRPSAPPPVATEAASRMQFLLCEIMKANNLGQCIAYFSSFKWKWAW